jgi:hypothetical protein
VRITRENVDKPSEPRDVTLRREEVFVEREPAGADAARAGARPSSPPPSKPPTAPPAPLM